MNSIKTILTLILVFTSLSSIAFSQEFNWDGSMKLTTISKDKKYGYKPDQKHSIKVGEIQNQYTFLKSLRGPNGEKIQAQRIASCCSFKSKKAIFGTGLLDVWEITYDGLKKPLTIYLNGYDYETPQCPSGLSIKPLSYQSNPESISDNEIVKVIPCHKNSYAVDDFLLKEKIGEKEFPSTNPSYLGGLDSMKVYFEANPLSGGNVSKMVFSVSIAFEVNCKGGAGNFVVISKGQRDLATYSNQVLSIVNNMPQNWQAAKVNGKPVDCYQILLFSVTSGQLDNLSYR